MGLEEDFVSPNRPQLHPFPLRTAQPQVNLGLHVTWFAVLGSLSWEGLQGCLQGRKDSPYSCEAWEPGVKPFLVHELGPNKARAPVVSHAQGGWLRVTRCSFWSTQDFTGQLGDQVGVDQATVGWFGSSKATANQALALTSLLNIPPFL